MSKFSALLGAGILAAAASAASAATYTFSFDNVGGAVSGTVSGTIELADGDGTFEATSVIVDSAPVELGYSLALDFLDTANGYTRDFGNSFTVLNGEIVAADFGRLNFTEGLLLGDSDFGTFLNIVGSATQFSGVLDGGNTTLSFGTVAAVPLPATLPLLLVGLGGVALARRRKAA